MAHDLSRFRPVGRAESFDPASRRALFKAMSQTPVMYDGQVGVFQLNGCDLTCLNEGRSPVLLDHDRSIRSVVGVCELGWVKDDAVWVVARFGEGKTARLAWENVRGGVWPNCSLGVSIRAMQKVDGIYCITDFVADELSLVWSGWISDAAVKPSHNLNEIYQYLNERREAFKLQEAERRRQFRAEGAAARRQYLHRVARFIAPDLNVDETKLLNAMDHFIETTTPEN